MNGQIETVFLGRSRSIVVAESTGTDPDALGLWGAINNRFTPEQVRYSSDHVYIPVRHAGSGFGCFDDDHRDAEVLKSTNEPWITFVDNFRKCFATLFEFAGENRLVVLLQSSTMDPFYSLTHLGPLFPQFSLNQQGLNDIGYPGIFWQPLNTPNNASGMEDGQMPHSQSEIPIGDAEQGENNLHNLLTTIVAPTIHADFVKTAGQNAEPS
ncbi:hypothetical protein GYMLUDRAFT_248093 [Collybiopsis luxurians FD-317 M1]|uniref:Uncharacterized protein n=1 Tax=Collybiopsis luxurians FD-317 M1 TaxID=944289 RepID=A0A0D0AZF3_9AGAR|nr:hypothetical protein GYMLUDRAFT_248093 [Collybiopsis luxurians FD-317 M1]